MDVEQVDVVHGDTGKIAFGMGTYGSRSIAVGGQAVKSAMDKIIAKGRRIAAHLLEAGAGDVEFKDGAFTVAGTDRSKCHVLFVNLGEAQLEAAVYEAPGAFGDWCADSCDYLVDPVHSRINT